jgi:hypothetical protein
MIELISQDIILNGCENKVTASSSAEVSGSSTGHEAMAGSSAEAEVGYVCGT